MQTYTTVTGAAGAAFAASLAAPPADAVRYVGWNVWDTTSTPDSKSGAGLAITATQPDMGGSLGILIDHQDDQREPPPLPAGPRLHLTVWASTTEGAAAWLATRMLIHIIHRARGKTGVEIAVGGADPDGDPDVEGYAAAVAGLGALMRPVRFAPTRVWVPTGPDWGQVPVVA